jgi:glycosyltransferase involved in cell wall biosynthesis
LADGIIAISSRYVEDLEAAGVSPERIVMIDDAVDSASFHPMPPEPGYFQNRFNVSGLPLVGMVGRVSEFKRVVEFLEIVAALRLPAENQTRFLVIGDTFDDGYNRRVQLAMDRLALGDRVRFIGRCAGCEMPRLLASLDVLVTLSGGSIMFEAMACGKTVLSVRADGRHSRHTRDGLTAVCVTSSRPEAAAAALAGLLGDAALRQRLGRNAREWVEEHLSVKTMTEKTAAFYERLLAVSTC